MDDASKALYFSYRRFQAERSVKKTYTDPMDELAALRVVEHRHHPGAAS